MYPSFQNKRYVIKVIIIYVLERKITDLKIRGVVGPMLAPKLSAKLNIFKLLSYNCDSFNPFQTAYGEDFLKKMGIPPDSSARNSILDHVKHVLSYTIQFLLWYTF